MAVLLAPRKQAGWMPADSTNMNLFPNISPPDGYRLLEDGELMLKGDIFWAYPGQWMELGEDSDFNYPFGPSYRPVARVLLSEIVAPKDS